jgi:hypothetical protein
MSDNPNPAAEPVQKRRGCFFYGCLTGIILLVIVLGASVAGYFAIKKKLNALLDNYTDSQPMALPSVHMSSDDYSKLMDRWNNFENSLKTHKDVAPLVLTSDEINALIENGYTNSKSIGRFYITIDGDKLKGDLSLSLESLSPRIFKGRYLNGSSTLDVTLRDGVFIVSPESIDVKGKPLPRETMDVFRNLNFAGGLTNDAHAMTIIHELQSVQVKDGKVIVTPKEDAAPAEKPQ